MDDDFVAQVEQALRNIVDILAEADARPEHLVRLTWYITDKREYVARSSEVGQAYRRVVGRHFPAMTLVQVAALLDDRAKVEIEATAVVPTPAEVRTEKLEVRSYSCERIAHRSGKSACPTVSRR